MFLPLAIAALIFIFTPAEKNSRQKDFVQIRVAETTVIKGKKNLIRIEVTVQQGYHIQANKVHDESLIPAKLEITPIPQLIIDSPVYPRFSLFRLEGTDEDLNVFDGKFEIKVPVKAVKGTAAGKYVLKASFRYQACDHKSCFFPRTINFKMAIMLK
jgi:hypothetical protein